MGDSLEAEWLFDDCGNGTVLDTSGFNNNGTMSGSPTCSTDTPFGTGRSLGFNTSNSVYANVPNLPTGAMTVSAWVKTVAPRNWHNIVNHNWTVNGGWILQTDVSGLAWFGLYLGGQYNAASSVLVTPGVWTYLVGVYDGSNITMYLNGVPGSPTALSNAVSTTGSIIIGGGVNGNVDNVRIYSRALTAMEIRERYLAEAPRHGLAFAGSLGLPGYLQ